MEIYVKGYALGVLYGLLFFLLEFNPSLQIDWSLQKQWIAIFIFSPALIYFILSYAEFNVISFKKENIKKTLCFLLGIFLSMYALYSIWGFPK